LNITNVAKYANKPAQKAIMKYPIITGRVIFKTDNLNKPEKLKFFKKLVQLLYVSCQFKSIIAEPILIDKRKVKTLNQVLVSRLPNRALIRFTRKRKARNSAAIGPVPGRIPRNTPRPNPRAIFCGVSLILKSFI